MDLHIYYNLNNHLWVYKQKETLQIKYSFSKLIFVFKDLCNNDYKRCKQMTQEELLKRYHEKNIEEEISFTKAYRYYKTARKFYEDLQDGTASEINFFENTMVTYEECEPLKRKPDFESYSGSCYWYSKKGVVRRSDHWGCGIVNCDWPYHKKDGKTIYGSYYKNAKSGRVPKWGFAKWTDFLFKAREIEIDGKPVITTFNNTIGRDLLKIDDKVYHRKIIEVFEEYRDEQ